MHVWRVRVGAAREEDAAVLDAGERRRADGLRRGADRRRFVTVRAALRLLAGAYLEAAPAGLRFRPGAHGKPALEGAPAPLRFNLSHAGDLVLLAFARDLEVGVDVERRRELPDEAALHGVACTAAERRGLAALAPGARAAAFFDLWAGKEAALKALGRGLSISPRAVELPVPWASPVRARVVGEDGPAELTIRPLPAGDGCSAALAHAPVAASLVLLDAPALAALGDAWPRPPADPAPAGSRR